MVKMEKKLIYLIGSLLVLLFSFATYYPFMKPPQNKQITQNRYVRGHNIPGKLYWAGSAQDKEVALTFDDGPEEEWTPKILAILKQKNVKATFFVIGKQAKKYPEQLQRINADGHIIGNHTFNHVNLAKLAPPQIDQELDECASAIYDIIGKIPTLVRPPYGLHNETVDNAVYSKNRIIVLWSLDTKDWTGLDPTVIKSRIIPNIQNGYIVLQHDGENRKLGGSVQALPAIIDDLKAQGYTFVTIPELLDTQPYQ